MTATPRALASESLASGRANARTAAGHKRHLVR